MGGSKVRNIRIETETFLNVIKRQISVSYSYKSIRRARNYCTKTRKELEERQLCMDYSLRSNKCS